MAMSMKIPVYDPTCQECPHQGASYRTNIDSHPCHMDHGRRCVGHALTKKNVSDEVVEIEVDCDNAVHITRKHPSERNFR